MSSLDTLHHRSEWWTTWCQWWNRRNWPQFMQDLKKSIWRLKLAAIYAKFFASGKSTFHSEINQKPVLFLCNSPLFLSEIQRCICFIFKNRKKFMFSFTEQKCSILDIVINWYVLKFTVAQDLSQFLAPGYQIILPLPKPEMDLASSISLSLLHFAVCLSLPIPNIRHLIPNIKHTNPAYRGLLIPRHAIIYFPRTWFLKLPTYQCP